MERAAGRPDPAEPPLPPFPWPPDAGEPVLEAWGRTWHGAALEPRRFFASLPHDGSLGAAILFYLSIGIPVAGSQLFWRMLGIGGMPGDGAATGWSPLTDFLASPLVLLVAIFLAAGVTHVLLLIVGGAGGRFGVTARVFAYAYAPQLLGIVPAIGSSVGFVWMVVVAIAGIREAHRTTRWKAAAAILIPLGIGLIFVVIAAFMAMAGGLLHLPL